MSNIAPASRRDLYAEITAQIVAAIELVPGNPTLPWRRDRSALHLPVNALTKNPYAGINVVSLWAEGAAKGFIHPI